MARVYRTLRLYSIAARTPEGPIDYEALFRALSAADGPSTQIDVRPDLSLAVESSTRLSHITHFTFVSGDPTQVPLLYDQATGEAVERPLDDNVLLARRTIVSIAPGGRTLSVEMTNAGVSAVNLERYLSRYAQVSGLGERVAVDINPIPDDSFLAEVERYERIREATVTLNQPNPGWEDADNAVAGVTEESNGQRASITINAARGQSLQRRRGIMAVIREAATKVVGNVRNASVTGTRTGDDFESTVSLERHQRQQRISMDAAISAAERAERVRAEAAALVGSVDDEPTANR